MRRRGGMSVDDRALVGSTQRAASEAVPLAIDDDTTPLPMLPPDPAEIDGYDALPAPMRAHLEKLHHAQQEQDVAICRMWDSRDAAAQIGELRGMAGEMLRTVRVLANVPAALNAQALQIAELRRGMELMATKFDRALELLDNRIALVECSHVKTDSTLVTLENRVAEAFAGATRLVDQLDEAFEKRSAKHDGAIDKQEARIKSLEDDRLRVKAWVALIALLSSVAAFLVGKFWPK